MLNKNKEKFYEGIKIVLRQLANYKKELILLSFLGVVSAILNGIVPYLTGRLFDAILTPTKIFEGDFWGMPSWLFFIILWLIIRLASDVVDWVINIKSGRIEEFTHSDYIINGFNTLLELPMSFHKDKKMGEIINRINRAADWLSRIAGDVIITLSPQFLSIFVALSICFYVNYILALILTVGVFSYILVLIKVAPPLAVWQRKTHRAYGKAHGDAYDAVFNVVSIKQAVAENYEQRKIFRNFRLKAVKLWGKMADIWTTMSFYQRFIITLIQFAIFGSAIIFILKGQMTVGELIMFNGYAFMLFSPFTRLGHNWNVIQNGLIALERVEKILSTPKEIYVPENVVSLSDIKGEIEFKNIYFSYPSSRLRTGKSGKSVLEDISFKVKPGEVIALVGESGVGKSTLIDLISGYYFPTGGNVLIDGHNIRNLDLKFLRSKIGVVPQEVVLFNDTIETNIKYGSFGASGKRVKEAVEKSHCLEFIEKFPKKWKQIVGERGVKLSVGQKQRVAIARAILRNPKILILDEPTSALDAKSENIIQESLEELMKGKTTFIIAHRLSTVRNADKILVLDKGKIVESGAHDELLKIKNGIYRHLYELQIGLQK